MNGVRNLLDGPPTRRDEQVASVLFALAVLTAAALITIGRVARRPFRTHP